MSENILFAFKIFRILLKAIFFFEDLISPFEWDLKPGGQMQQWGPEVHHLVYATHWCNASQIFHAAAAGRVCVLEDELTTETQWSEWYIIEIIMNI